MSNQLLTTKQMAEVLSVSEGTVRAWARTGRIPYVFLAGRDYRFSRADVLKALAVVREQQQAQDDTDK